MRKITKLLMCALIATFLFTAVTLTAQVTVTTNAPIGSETPDKLVDNDLNTLWSTNAKTMWLMFDFASPKAFVNYKITSTYDYSGTRDMKSWALKGSNDNVNWTTLDNRTDIKFPAPSSSLMFYFSNTVVYKYYRFDPIYNNGDGVTRVAEITFGTIPDNVVPTAPTNLSSSYLKSTTATLSWTASTDNMGIYEYKIYENSTLLGTTDGITTSILLHKLTPSTTYSNITVVGYDYAGNISAASNVLELTTLAPSLFDGLIGDWKLDEGTGLVATNSASSLYNGKYDNASGAGMSWMSTGIKGGSVILDGAGKSLFKTPYIPISTNTFTFSIWIYGAFKGSTWAGIFFARNDFNKGIHSNKGEILAGNVANGQYGTSLVIPDNEWTFVTVTVTPTLLMAYMRVAGSKTFTSFTQAGNFPLTNIGVINIGGDGWGSNVAAQIDNARLFTRALSSSEVAELYDLDKPTDDIAPTAPTNLSVSNIGSSSVTLNWTASTDNVSVARYKAFYNSVEIGSYIGANPTMNLTGLTSNYNYSNVTIVASDLFNTSDASNSISFTTLPATSAKDIYVSASNTSGVEDGSLANPFNTIQKGANSASPGDRVLIREGVYREQVSITKDGITFEGYNGEKAVVNGADRLNNWTLESGTTYKTTDMNWAVNDGGNQLFVDQTMINLARWPNQTSTDVIKPTDGVATSVTYDGNLIIIKCDDFNEPDGRWVGAQVWLNLSKHGHDGQGWTGTIKATSQANHTITVDYKTIYANPAVPVKSGPWAFEATSEFYLFNPLSAAVVATGGVDALLSPGEWWKDGNNLYVKMPNEQAPANVNETTNVVESKKRLFAFTPGVVNRNSITFRNLDIFAATINTDINYFSNNGSKEIKDVYNIIIDNVNAKYVSHFTDQTGNFQNQWYGRAGIILSGQNNIIRNSTIKYSAGPGLCIMGNSSKMLNNVISDCNYMCTNAGAVNMGFVLVDGEIGHNVVDNTTVMGLHIGGLVNSNLKNKGVARIHNNKISNTMMRSWDSGAIDMVGKDGQWVRIDHNTVYNTDPVPLNESSKYGIYLDFGAGSGSYYPGRYIVHHNIIYNVNVPILINHIMDVLVYNNTGVLNGVGANGIQNGNGGVGAKDSIVNNIFGGTFNKDSWGSLLGAYKKNNIFDAYGPKLYDLFVDPDNYNFNLKSTAEEAINKGMVFGPWHDEIIELPDLGALESQVTSVSKLKSDMFSLYPNPSVGGNFNFVAPPDFVGQKTELYIYNTMGMVVYHKTIQQTDKTHVVNTGNNCNLSGVYFVSLRSKNRSEQVKLIVE